MAKYTTVISGNCQIGSMAFGTGATAVGSVTVSEPHKAPTKCEHCSAPIKTERKDCAFCGTDYPQGVGANVGSISITIED